MLRNHLRFYVPETPEEELELVRARVRERGQGLKVSTALFGGSALAGAAVAVAARLIGGAARLLLPAGVILIVIPGAALAIVAASSLLWRTRLRRLGREPKPRPTLSPFRRKSHGRSRFHCRDRRVLLARDRLHERLRASLRR